MKLEEKKEVMKQLALDLYSNGGSIYWILNSEDIDHIIAKITDKYTKPNVKSLIDHDLSGEEQFLMLLSETLCFIESAVPVLKHVEIHILNMLEEKVPEYLISKKYWGDNKNIAYFNYNIKKLIVENFYDNIKYMYSDHKAMFEREKITLDLDLKKKKDVDLLFKYLVKLIWCNYDRQYNLGCLFINHKFYARDYNKTEEEKECMTHRHYDTQFDVLEDSYFARINIVEKLLS